MRLIDHYSPLPFWAFPFIPLCWIYRALAGSRNWLYDRGLLPTVRVSVPVISIGNLTTGGTGKTPVVEALTRQLMEQGHKVVILTRGYKASAPQEYAPATDPAYGDEAFQLQQALPNATVIVGKNRSRNAQQAIVDYQPDVLVLDDGFQHRKLHRDLDIVLIDGPRGLGNAHSLPLGPLRESIFGLKRTSAIWITKLAEEAAIPPALDTLLATFMLPVERVEFAPTGFKRLESDELLLLEALGDQPALLVSGIANPDRFEADIRAAEVQVLQHLRYPDHHAYALQDVAVIQAALGALPPDTRLITTDKDATKLARLLGPNLVCRTVTLQIQAQIPVNAIDDILPALARQDPQYSVYMSLVQHHEEWKS